MSNTPTETERLRADVEALKDALTKVLAYNDRLKKERDGSRGENAALKSKLADAATAPSMSAVAKALSGGLPNSGNDPRVKTSDFFKKRATK